MNDAHLHLVVNHLPIVFPIAGLVVLIITVLSKSEAVKRTAYLLFIISAISTALASATGEEAEEMVENLDGYSHELIHEHEEHAETFALASYSLGLISLFALWASMKEKSYEKWLLIGVFALALVCIFLSSETGTSGGEIRHIEIRGN